ncbi:hypothetical protein INR49_010992, partial [Caranx melampygus]
MWVNLLRKKERDEDDSDLRFSSALSRSHSDERSPSRPALTLINSLQGRRARPPDSQGLMGGNGSGSRKSRGVLLKAGPTELFVLPLQRLLTPDSLNTGPGLRGDQLSIFYQLTPTTHPASHRSLWTSRKVSSNIPSMYNRCHHPLMQGPYASKHPSDWTRLFSGCQGNRCRPHSILSPAVGRLAKTWSPGGGLGGVWCCRAA